METRMARNRIRERGDGLISELTPQERKIFDLIGAGHSNRNVADELFLAEKTVKNYVSNVLSKLGLTRRTEVAALAARIEERESLWRT
jgi:two-component system response regulator DevR